MSARLVDASSGFEYPLAGGANAIGRRAENDVVLPGPAVSRFHAEIRHESGDWIIEDQGSTYGTYLNGEKVSGARRLADGDAVRIGVTAESPQGEYNLVFRLGPAPPEPPRSRRARPSTRRGQIDEGRTSTEAVGRALVVRMSGVFRRHEVDALAAELRGELVAGARPAVLDLREVTYMNSYALSVLVDLAAAHREKGVMLRAFGAAGSVRKLLTMPGEASPIEICGSETEALGK